MLFFSIITCDVTIQFNENVGRIDFQPNPILTYSTGSPLPTGQMLLSDGYFAEIGFQSNGFWILGDNV